MLATKLQKGDICKIVAPSFSVQQQDETELNRGIDFLEKSIGLKCVLADDINKEEYIIKAKSLNKVLKDESKICIAARGGDGCENILKYVEYTNIMPKIICGFSDITSLLNYIYLKTGLITFHASTVKALGRVEDEKLDNRTFIDFKEKFINNNFKYVDKIHSVNNGANFEGKLLGGNLSCFTKLMDLNVDIDLTKHIIFLEELGYESDEKNIIENLKKLEKANGFKNISGFLIGNYVHESKAALEDIIKREYAKYNFSIVKGDFFGHGKLNLIIPIGAKAKIDIEKKEFIIDEKVLKED
ncbi:MAG: LD-carboxypeptidase [Clostridia bacterium]